MPALGMNCGPVVESETSLAWRFGSLRNTPAQTSGNFGGSAAHQFAQFQQPGFRNAGYRAGDGDRCQRCAVLVVQAGRYAVQAYGMLLTVTGESLLTDFTQVGTQCLYRMQGVGSHLIQTAFSQYPIKLIVRQ